MFKCYSDDFVTAFLDPWHRFFRFFGRMVIILWWLRALFGNLFVDVNVEELATFVEHFVHITSQIWFLLQFFVWWCSPNNSGLHWNRGCKWILICLLCLSSVLKMRSSVSYVIYIHMIYFPSFAIRSFGLLIKFCRLLELL